MIDPASALALLSTLAGNLPTHRALASSLPTQERSEVRRRGRRERHCARLQIERRRSDRRKVPPVPRPGDVGEHPRVHGGCHARQLPRIGCQLTLIAHARQLTRIGCQIPLIGHARQLTRIGCQLPRIGCQPPRIGHARHLARVDRRNVPIVLRYIVVRVPHDGVPQGQQVSPQLVGAAGERPQPHFRDGAQSGMTNSPHALILRHRLLPVDGRVHSAMPINSNKQY
eukprot:1194265-Prorocentrum_minimum.AAC.2